MTDNAVKRAEKFLSIADQFKLGRLVTEQPHPATNNLSSLAADNLPEAISILKELDRQTIEVLSEKKKQICYLKNIIHDTIKSGNNIYFCGCGATGRLSITIETLWRQVNSKDNIKDRVFSFGRSPRICRRIPSDIPRREGRPGSSSRRTRRRWAASRRCTCASVRPAP